MFIEFLQCRFLSPDNLITFNLSFCKSLPQFFLRLGLQIQIICADHFYINFTFFSRFRDTVYTVVFKNDELLLIHNIN